MLNTDEITSAIFDGRKAPEWDWTSSYAEAVEFVMRYLLDREDLELRICDGRLSVHYAKSGEDIGLRVGSAGVIPDFQSWRAVLVGMARTPEREPWYQEAPDA